MFKLITMLTIVTGNIGKYESAKRRLDKFGIELEFQKIDLVEPQVELIEEVAIFKAKDAFKQVNKPLVISDSGWSVPSLNGFPGPFMHFISDWLTAEDWFNLMRDKKDRSITLTDIVVYIDKENLETFRIDRTGEILKEKKGEGIPIRTITTMRKDKLTIQECLDQGLETSDDGTSAWNLFGEYYSESFL